MPGNAPWLEAAQGATDALYACVSKSKWSLGVRDIAKLATTASKLAKASRGKARAAGTSSISELVPAIANYAMRAPAYEAAEPASWCVLLHGLVSASQALPGNPAHPQLVALAAHASGCMQASCGPNSWSPAHNPSLRPQTLSSLLWVFAVLGFKTAAPKKPSQARSVATSPGSIEAAAGPRANGTGTRDMAGGEVREVMDMNEPLRQVLDGVLQSVQSGGMRTGKAREWVLLLWALAKVGAPAKEVEAALHEAGAETAICAPMAVGLCNAQDISNAIWAVAEGRFVSLQAPVLRAAAAGLQARNVLLEAAPSPNQSLQAASNTVWAVHQILCRRESARAAEPPPTPTDGSGEVSKVSRESMDNSTTSSTLSGQQRAARTAAAAELQEAGVQVTVHCVHALKHHLLHCYAPSHTHAPAPAPAQTAAPGQGPAAEHAHDAPETSPSKPANSSAANLHKHGPAMPLHSNPISPSVRAGWSNSASMSASALASMGVYDEQLFCLVVAVVLQGAMLQGTALEQGYGQTGGRDTWQGVESGGGAGTAQGMSAQHPHQQQQQEQRQQLQRRRQRQRDGSREAHTDVASTLWACARVGHGLHGEEQWLGRSRVSSQHAVNSSSCESHSVGWGKGGTGSDSSQKSQHVQPSDTAGEGESSAQEVEENGLKQPGETVNIPHDPTTQSQQQDQWLQGRLSSDLLALFKQYARWEGLPPHSMFTANGTATDSSAMNKSEGTQGTVHSARSITMALFALAVLCPVLMAEQQWQRKQAQQQQQQEPTRLSYSQEASTGAGQQADESGKEDGFLAGAALALFRAAAARPPSQFGVHGLTQLHMAFMEVTESGLLSNEQLTAAGWCTDLHIRDIRSIAEPGSSASKAQAPMPEANSDESVAAAAAKAWHAGQGAGAQLVYAQSGGWEQADSPGLGACGIDSGTDRRDESGSAPDPPVPDRRLRLHVSRSQHEVLEALQRMGFAGMQVEGATADGAMRVDILLPRVQLSVLEPYLLAVPHSYCRSDPDQKTSAGIYSPGPAAFGPVAIEFNGPDHYLLIPAGVPDGPTLLRRRALLRRVEAVVSIPWWDWAAMQGQDKAKEQYLAQRLVESLLDAGRSDRGG